MFYSDVLEQRSKARIGIFYLSTRSLVRREVILVISTLCWRNLMKLFFAWRIYLFS